MKYLVVVGIIIFIMIAVAIDQSIKKKRKVQELGGEESFPLGKYLAGIAGRPSPVGVVSCVVTQDDFVFIGGSGEDIGRIPRDSINQIILDDKSTITKRLTVTRMATLGIFALAVPKKGKEAEYCVAIDWDNKDGENQNTVFEFTGFAAQTLAGQAADRLKQLRLPKISQLRHDEKKCPFCAETIKAEARKCRYCGSEL